MAVYTRFNDSELENFLSHYNLGTVENLQEIAQGVENSNYFLTTTTGKYVLTIYEKRVATDDLPYFLSFTEFLNKQSILTPLAVRTNDDQFFTNFMDGKKAAIIHFLEGHNLDVPNSLQCKSVGSFVAKMHLLQAGFRMERKNDLSPVGSLWGLYNKVQQDIQIKLPHFADFIASKVTYLKAHYPKNLEAGTIHADIFPDNVFFNQNEAIGIIDFYFSCHDFLAYDLAIVLCAWCFNKGHFKTDKFLLLLDAYQFIRPLKKDEKASLLILMQGAAMRFFLTRAHDYMYHDPNALVIPKDPQEYYDILCFLENKKLEDLYYGA